ncbi:hypothetical protein K439DRAFT_1614996 [Ramaria rubella]|nr:hypothetical protein K439DRAFT_1614996 [Ramaria rubella]
MSLTNSGRIMVSQAKGVKDNADMPDTSDAMVILHGAIEMLALEGKMWNEQYKRLKQTEVERMRLLVKLPTQLEARVLVYNHSLPEWSWKDIPPGATVSCVEVLLAHTNQSQGASGVSDPVGEEEDAPGSDASGREFEGGGVNEDESNVMEERSAEVKKAHGPDVSQLDQDFLKFLKDALQPFLDGGGRFLSYKKNMDFLDLSECLVRLFSKERSQKEVDQFIFQIKCAGLKVGKSPIWKLYCLSTEYQ